MIKKKNNNNQNDVNSIFAMQDEGTFVKGIRD